MKKLYGTLIAVGAAAVLAGLGGSADAKVTGPCANCHTMHNSQNGTVMGNTTATNDSLTIDTCAGCHKQDNAADRLTSVDAPAIWGDAASTATVLPGGYINSANADNTKHNVNGTGAQDGVLANTPPGYMAVAAGLPANAAGWGTNRLTCAGSFGCHGNHSYANETVAIAGGHHNDTAVGFRLLAGIDGTESSASYKGFGDTDGNAYDGINGNSATVGSGTITGYEDTTTISYLCGECHGLFHSVGASANTNLNTTRQADPGGTPWLRHPTDFRLGNASQAWDSYASYGTAGTNAYDEEVPVGAPLSATTRGTAALPATPADGIVLCISCHRAHGSDNADLLRWNYDNMIAGGGGANSDTGCFRCHTNKD
ncbi:MAG: cytochrome c3 family protein [Thermodesulfobacteriota bacterium]